MATSIVTLFDVDYLVTFQRNTEWATSIWNSTQAYAVPQYSHEWDQVYELWMNTTE